METLLSASHKYFVAHSSVFTTCGVQALNPHSSLSEPCWDSHEGFDHIPKGMQTALENVSQATREHFPGLAKGRQQLSKQLETQTRAL